MVRVPCCEKMGLRKGPWTLEEDHILISYVQRHGHENWRALPKLAGLLRCGKSCRLRWTNYLRPDIKRGNFSKEEEETIIKLHQTLGNRWSAIATRLPGRTDNEIKNYWHTHLKKGVEHDLARPKILRCSVQTPILRTSSQRTPQCCTSSDQLDFQYNSYNLCFAPKVPEKMLSVKQSTQESCLQANGNAAEINGIKPVHQFAMTNKSMDAPECSRLEQILSARQSILQPRDDRINNDMFFWYNLLMDAGRMSQES